MVTVSFDQLIEEIEKVAGRFELDETISEKLDENASYLQKICIKG